MCHKLDFDMMETAEENVRKSRRSLERARRIGDPYLIARANEAVTDAEEDLRMAKEMWESEADL